MVDIVHVLSNLLFSGGVKVLVARMSLPSFLEYSDWNWFVE